MNPSIRSSNNPSTHQSTIGDSSSSSSSTPGWVLPIQSNNPVIQQSIPLRLRVLLFRGRGLISALIRWQTGSPYSHAALLVDDTWLYEAWQGSGVRMKRFDWTDTENIDFFEITTGRALLPQRRLCPPAPTAETGLTPDQATRMLEYLNSRIGNNYDYRGVLRFVTRARPRRDNADFCSEYVYSAAEYAGLPLLARTEPSEVSPGLLSRSPFLKQVSVSSVPSVVKDFSPPIAA